MILEFRESKELTEVKLYNKIHQEFNDPKHFYCHACKTPWSTENEGHSSITCYKCKCGARFVRSSSCVKCGKNYEFTRNHWANSNQVICEDCNEKEKYLILYYENFDHTRGTEHNIWHYTISYPYSVDNVIHPGGYKTCDFIDYYRIIHTIPYVYLDNYISKYGYKYDYVYFENDLQAFMLGYLINKLDEYTHKDTKFKFGGCKTNLRKQ